MNLGDFFGPQFNSLLSIVSQSAIVWVPLVLIFIGWEIRLNYKREKYIESLEWALLEIRIPKEVFKSPLAMELVLTKALHQTGGVSTWYHKYVLGQVMLWSSLEIISLEGKIYFLIRTPVKIRPLVESKIYGQYPQAEINELPEDYTMRIREGKNTGWSMFGTEFALTKADPYPIKTYVDFGLDKASTSLESEQQIDPITSTLEYMGSMKEGEQMWLQILVRAHWAKRYSDPKKFLGKRELKDLAKEEIKKILKEPTFSPKKDDKGKPTETTAMNLSEGQKDAISAIERNMDKMQFDCGIRAIYIAKKDKFNTAHITGLLSLMKQFNSSALNGFKIQNATAFDYPWQDPTGRRGAALKQELFNAYRMRSYFYSPHHRKPFVLSSEELATIYHFPGRVSETPSFKRIESKKSEPPVDLPV